MRRGGAAFPFQRTADGARSFLRNRAGRICSLGVVARRLGAGSFGSFALLRRWKFYSSPTGLGQPNGNSLLGGAGAVLPFPDMIHLLANKLSRLRGSRFPLAFVLRGALQRFLFGHANLLGLKFQITTTLGLCFQPRSERSFGRPAFPAPVTRRNERPASRSHWE